jgi:hypothetical protein
MGHDNVWVLDGGLPLGKRNLPVENPKRTYQVGNFESKIQTRSETTEQILANIDSSSFDRCTFSDRFSGETKNQEPDYTADIFLVQLIFRTQFISDDFYQRRIVLKYYHATKQLL